MKPEQKIEDILSNAEIKHKKLSSFKIFSIVCLCFTTICLILYFVPMWENVKYDYNVPPGQLGPNIIFVRESVFQMSGMPLINIIYIGFYVTLIIGSTFNIVWKKKFHPAYKICFITIFCITCALTLFLLISLIK